MYIRRLENLPLLSLLLARSFELNQLRKDQTHIPTFIHDRCPAIGTGHLGRQDMFLISMGRRIKRQTACAIGE